MLRASRSLRSAALLLMWSWSGCGSRPAPSVHCAAPLVVAYPPPPAQIEYVSEATDNACEWIDGSWEWVGRRWQWKPGAWVVPPPGCRRAAPVMVWLESEQGGALFYRPASFCPLPGSASASAESRQCAAPKPCPKPPPRVEPGAPDGEGIEAGINSG